MVSNLIKMQNILIFTNNKMIYWYNRNLLCKFYLKIKSFHKSFYFINLINYKFLLNRKEN